MEKDFGRAEFRHACKALLTLQVMQPDVKMAINVSPHLMVDSQFTENCHKILAEVNVDPKCLILEI